MMAAQRKTPALPAVTCIPSGPLTPPVDVDYQCRCGERLHAKPTAGGTDWIWVTEVGEAFRDDTPQGLIDNPEKWWADLAATNIGAYSNGRCAMDIYGFGYFTHGHQPDRPAEEREPGKVPWCCGWPMWARPDGWVCRVNRMSVFAYADGTDG